MKDEGEGGEKLLEMKESKGHLLVQPGFDAVEHRVGPRLRTRPDDHVVLGAGGNLGEPGSHDPRPDHSNAANVSHARTLATGR